jgi:hypothetical protein
MKKILLASLLSATALMASTAMAEVSIRLDHTQVSSKAPIFEQQLLARYQLPPEFVDLQDQRLSKDIGGQTIKTPRTALEPGKNWFGFKHVRVYPYLDQYPEVKDLVVSYMYRQGITNFLDVPNFVTVQQAVDSELDYDLLNHRWSLNDIKEYIKDENHPFVVYHKSRLSTDDYRMLEQALNSQPAQANAVTSLKTMIVHGMVLNDFYQRRLPVVNINEGTN